MNNRLLFIGTAPTRGHHDDAGFDLYVNGDWTVEPNSFVDIDLNCAVAFPAGTWGLLTGRSSTLRKRGLLVAQGIIDTGYTGPLFAGVQNLTSEPVHVEHGERIAQLVLMANLATLVELEEVTEMPNTARGANGFGSTGN
jgi:dUTP pyrophosphatase